MIPALCAGLQMVIFGWGLSVADNCCQHQLCGNPSSPSCPPVESCVNAGLDSMAEASAVNYRMFVAFEVWPTGFAQPLCTHRVLGHLCSSMFIFSHQPAWQTPSHTPQIDSCDCVWKSEEKAGKLKMSWPICEVFDLRTNVVITVIIILNGSELRICPRTITWFKSKYNY